MFYKYQKNKSSLKRKVTKICYKSNKEFSTDGDTLIVKARPKFFFKYSYIFLKKGFMQFFIAKCFKKSLFLCKCYMNKILHHHLTL